MRGIIFLSYCLLCSLCFCVTSAKAQDNPVMEKLFTPLLGKLGEVFSSEVGRGFENMRANKQQKRPVAGYCQVWRNDRLAVQKRCHAVSECGADGFCTHRYIWPNGGQTELIADKNRPLSINGKPTAYMFVGSDTCVTDGPPSNLFCFTTSPQSPKAKITAPPAKTRTVETLAIDPIKPKPTSLPAPAPDTSAAADGFGGLLESYISASESSSPQAQQRRCKLGLQLVVNHSAALDEELNQLIRDQLKQDDCL